MKRLLVVCMLMIMAACAPDELKEQKMPDESLSTGGEQTAPAAIPSTQENAQESAVESASDHDASMDDAAGINIDKFCMNIRFHIENRLDERIDISAILENLLENLIS